MQYALVSSTCKTTRRNMTLAVERDVKATNKSKPCHFGIFLIIFRACWALDERKVRSLEPEVAKCIATDSSCCKNQRDSCEMAAGVGPSLVYHI